MKTVLETIQSGTGYLENAGIESARLNMESLLAHVLGCGRMQLYIDFDRPLDEDVLAPLRDLVRRRRAGEPLQHLLGTVEFFGRTFACDARALVPRPETEGLVEQALKRIQHMPAPVHSLDVGCGAGVIGLTLAAELGDRRGRIVLADTSEPALELTRENAARLGLSDAVEIIRSDLVSSIEPPDGGFDLTLANLPYVPREELVSLPEDVRRDPVEALDGGPGGIDVILRFAHSVGALISGRGVVGVEFGFGQSAPLRHAFSNRIFSSVSITVDLSGKERYLFASRQTDAPPH